MKRICIYPKDVQKIIGCSRRQAYLLLVSIRLAFKKEKKQYVTVQEFCMYTGIDDDLIDLK